MKHILIIIAIYILSVIELSCQIYDMDIKINKKEKEINVSITIRNDSSRTIFLPINNDWILATHKKSNLHIIDYPVTSTLLFIDKSYINKMKRNHLTVEDFFIKYCPNIDTKYLKIKPFESKVICLKIYYNNFKYIVFNDSLDYYADLSIPYCFDSEFSELLRKKKIMTKRILVSDTITIELNSKTFEDYFDRYAKLPDDDSNRRSLIERYFDKRIYYKMIINK